MRPQRIGATHPSVNVTDIEAEALARELVVKLDIGHLAWTWVTSIRQQDSHLMAKTDDGELQLRVGGDSANLMSRLHGWQITEKVGGRSIIAGACWICECRCADCQTEGRKSEGKDL